MTLHDEDYMNLPDLESADPLRMAAARRQIHNAATWLARIANSFREPAADRGHLMLDWDAERGALTTQRFAGSLAVELRLPQLHLQFLEVGRPVPHALDMEDRTPAAVEAWVLVELLHRGLERDRFSKALPYETALPMTGDSEKFAPAEYAAELALLTAWAQGASRAIAPMAGGAGIMCWPEPLQFGAILESGAPASNGGSRLRVAVSLGDERTKEPHFLVVPENHGTVQSLRPDAVLMASRIRADGLNGDAIRGFLAAAVGVNA